jgi:N-acetylmuramoyl-L-alanine amidase
MGEPGAVGARSSVRYHDRGVAVTLLQQRLVQLGYLDEASVDGVFGDATWHAVVAFQGWEGMPRDGVVGPITLRGLARARRPRPWISLKRALEVDLGRQVLLIVRNGVVERALHASSGASRFATPRGRFFVIRRERRSWSRPYRVWLPYALYFHRGWAIHGYPRVPDRPASHGCIRLALEDARLVFAQTGIGTTVIIRGAPSPSLQVPGGLAAKRRRR